MTKSQTLKILIILIVSVLVAGFGYGYFYYQIRFVNQATQIIRDETLLKSDQDIHLQSVRQILADSAGERREASERIIGADDVVNFIKTLEGLAKGQGLIVRTTGVSISELASSSPRYENVRLSLETSGTWSKNFAFLSLIETFPFAAHLTRATFKVNEENLDPKQKTKTAPLWKGDFEIEAVKRK